MFSIALFAFYFIMLIFVLHRLIKKQAALTFWQTSAAFSFKVLLGCLYGYIFLHYYKGDDTWNFFQDSLMEYQKLFQHPGIFFRDFLPDDAFKEAHYHFWEGMAFYLRNLEYWLMVKLLAIFNIFSRGNYYIDVLFFDFLVFWGCFLLYKLLLAGFPNKKNILLTVIFFIPPIVFWLSGIRAEGLVLLFMATILYYTDKWFEQRKIFHFVLVILALLGFLIFRLEFLLAFIPAFIAWTLCRKTRHRAIYYFIAVYLACLCIFFGSMLVSPQKNLSGPFIKRQQAFFSLHGNTRFKLDSLQPSVPGFIRVLPQALANTVARPFIWEAKGALQWMAAAEVIGCWVLLILLFIRPQKKWKKDLGHPLILLLLFYGISQIILIGYIVPFPGAIVRYKAIPELFLIIIIALGIDWGKIKLIF